MRAKLQKSGKGRAHLGEDRWVEELLKKTQSHASWFRGFGIGDDAAAYRPTRGKELLVCSDSLVETIHFKTKDISPRDLGWKSLAVNLSDLAAMGGRPRASLLNLSLPSEHLGSWSKNFIKGYLELSRQFRVALVGGDTTASPKPLFISVTTLGEISSAHIKTRDRARPGDLIGVTGFLGDSRAGLFLQSHSWKSSHRQKLLRAHHRPMPQCLQGQWLGQQKVISSMMDLSDGLWKDLHRLCQSSGVSTLLDPKKIPLSASLSAFAVAFQKEALMEAILGGEDYQLLFTCRPSSWKSLQRRFQKKFNQNLHLIGEVTPKRKNAISWSDPDFQKGSPEAFQAFEHF